MESVSALPKGTGLVRYVRALAATGELSAAAEMARGWVDTPETRFTLEKAAAAVQSTSDGLAEFGLSRQFYEIYRSDALVGRLSGRMRRAPFKTKIPAEGSGVVGDWVPESGNKPIKAMTFSQIELDAYKVAVLAVISKSLAAMSAPGAEIVVRRILAGAVSRTVDATFLSADAPIPGESPGGVAFDQQSHVSTGPSAAQVAADLSAMTALLGSWESPTWLTRPRTFGHLAGLGFVEFSAGGPLLWGFPVVTSVSAPAALLLADLGAIFHADDGESNIGLAQHPTVRMDDGMSPASEVEVSLWQQNLTGIKVERWVSWATAHGSAVVRMGVSY